MTGWHEIENIALADLLTWAEDQPWAQAMAACQQDAGWHAEGDVWTHTRMVAAELERLDEWAGFNQMERLKLAFTALFHDAGKPLTTIVDPETGRTRSPKHSLVGAELARRVLRDLSCPLNMREAIVNLVRYHGRPPYLLEKADPVSELIRLSWVVQHHLLHAFALADTRGRLTADYARAEDDIHLWKLVAEENNCFRQPYQFANEQARFLYFRDSLSSLHYVPREEYRCTVTLMSGLPGVGKDTWLAGHRSGLPVVSLDDIRDEFEVDPNDDQGTVVQTARERCRELLRQGTDFAFNATNTLRQTRARWIDLFADYGARVEICYLEPPLATVYRQNSQRKPGVPKRVIDRLISRLEPPSLTEAHAVEFI